ncbi:MAG: hypothetical protein QF752_14475 [Planctomycetota bacterium]|nr:hypothetical protein [Planctomycetota bacterium]
MKAALPKLLSIVVCDLVLRDERSKNTSLINTFNAILAAQFPCQHPRLHVFVSVTDGRGDYVGELRLVHYGPTIETILQTSGPLSIQDPNEICDLDFELNSIVFPKDGKYIFEFYCNDELIGSRPFTVTHEDTEFEDRGEEEDDSSFMT